MKFYYTRCLFLVVWFLASLGIFVSPPDVTGEEGSIRGRLFVSYSGDPSYDVMYGKNVEVLLLRGPEDLGKNFQSLRELHVNKIRSQEETVLKAMKDLRNLPRKERAKKDKELRETVKRETEKYDTLKSEYNKAIVALLEPLVIRKMTTTKEGEFSFQQVSAGRYYLHARYEISGAVNSFFWLQPVELKNNEQLEVKLNKATTTALY